MTVRCQLVKRKRLLVDYIYDGVSVADVSIGSQAGSNHRRWHWSTSLNRLNSSLYDNNVSAISGSGGCTLGRNDHHPPDKLHKLHATSPERADKTERRPSGEHLSANWPTHQPAERRDSHISQNIEQSSQCVIITSARCRSPTSRIPYRPQRDLAITLGIRILWINRINLLKRWTKQVREHFSTTVPLQITKRTACKNDDRKENAYERWSTNIVFNNRPQKIHSSNWQKEKKTNTFTYKKQQNKNNDDNCITLFTYWLWFNNLL